MNLTAHPHPLSRSRMSGAVCSLPHMPSLYAQGQLFSPNILAIIVSYCKSGHQKHTY